MAESTGTKAWQINRKLDLFPPYNTVLNASSPLGEADQVSYEEDAYTGNELDNQDYDEETKFD